MVALHPVRRALGRDQFADRGKTGRPHGCDARRRLTGSDSAGLISKEERVAPRQCMVAQETRLGTPSRNWRTPVVILMCGCLIAVLGFGARSGLGFFLTPMSSAYGWGREVFSLALAIQMLLWGAAQP